MKINSILIRLVFDLIVITLALTAPWFIAAPIAILGCFLIRDYFEILLVGLIIDAVQFNGSVGPVPFLFFLAGAVTFLIATKIRASILKFSI